MSTLINGLSEAGFIIRHLDEGLDLYPDLEAEPGTWNHFVAYAPPWFAIWATYERIYRFRISGPPPLEA